ncbi:hypothetical protein LOZ61_002950 [Ophidiomyces ophidiicola]|nr:hypothetical protein LOZ61_002950 [Ophidiomyces ophidiicola]KAI1920742.1 hypothetical protein LOZ64_001790 [Ophidiomyces ophidiicola]KAI1928595.1 hypothetical protein LOZ60_002316 [Ophidiomyces ophidiicola]KAI1961216.1 hypothetical protein LOZ59_002465 [Ophidiomyces ophidiicola]KAI2008814.1 hypothetical protein LOZ49_004131 [Ophidiomyces ophidiicola]
MSDNAGGNGQGGERVETGEATFGIKANARDLEITTSTGRRARQIRQENWEKKGSAALNAATDNAFAGPESSKKQEAKK